MGYRREPIAPDEWYHCYTRGIDKRITFQDDSDYRRFQQGLYLANSATNIERGRIQHLQHDELLRAERGRPIVDIGAYCLMPNHFHLLLKENIEGGIAKFMQKLGTSYTMYFNTKNKRIGALFVGPFRSRHIADDRYLSKIVPYIHLNPAELFEPEWKRGTVSNVIRLEMKIRSYPYSSLSDYLGVLRVENNIVSDSTLSKLLAAKMPTLNELLPEMKEYYQIIEASPL